MKTILLIILLIFFGCFGHSQERPKQDVHSQRIVAIYELVGNKTTGNSSTVTQYLLDSLGRCHTEIDYDLTSTIRYYRWITFNGMNKIKVQTFVDNKLVRVDSSVYDHNGILLKRFLFFPSEVGRESYVEKYSYSNINLLVSLVATTEKKETAYKATYTYDAHGVEVLRKVKTKRGYPLDSIVGLKRVVEYDSVGRVKNEKLEKVIVGGLKSKEWIAYKYTKKGQVEEKRFLDENGKTIYRIELLYRDDNSIWQEKTYNSEENLIKMLAWRTEVLPKLRSGVISGN